MKRNLLLQVQQAQFRAQARRDPRARAVMNGFGSFGADTTYWPASGWYDDSLAFNANFKKWANNNGFTVEAYGNCWYKIAYDYAVANSLSLTAIKAGTLAGFAGLDSRQFDPRARARTPQARNVRPVSTIPNSRWVNAGFQGFGYSPGDVLGVAPAFCRQPLKTAMDDLGASLKAAYEMGLENTLAVQQAARVFDSNMNLFERDWAVNPFTNACEDKVREVVNAKNIVNSFLGAHVPDPIRPSYDPNDEASKGSLSWLPWVAGAALALYAFTVVRPFIPKKA